MSISKLGALDSQEWRNPAAIEAVHRFHSDNKLPNPHEALVAFFRGALETWERFSSAFEAGGVVDQMTQCERDDTLMSSTNDANEEALGSYRLHVRQKPLVSMHNHNS